MIARIWRGATHERDAEAYVEYLRGTGLREYRETPGNLGAWVLWRAAGGRAEFVTLSFWESEEAVRGFAGDEIDRAVFYPEDDRYLIERDETVAHYHVSPE
ncbi:MAG: antibiotic biosynthesis monooxygenase [Actinomycetota bacterium]|nr:antibiotic biosynthesis monooxygenase [Actinomycetota bacterium]